MNTNSADVVDTGVDIGDVRRGHGYEGLDPSVIAALRQTPSIPHHYSALATAAESTQEMMEMSQFNGPAHEAGLSLRCMGNVLTRAVRDKVHSYLGVPKCPASAGNILFTCTT